MSLVNTLSKTLYELYQDNNLNKYMLVDIPEDIDQYHVCEDFYVPGLDPIEKRIKKAIHVYFKTDKEKDITELNRYIELLKVMSEKTVTSENVFTKFTMLMDGIISSKDLNFPLLTNIQKVTKNVGVWGKIPEEIKRYNRPKKITVLNILTEPLFPPPFVEEESDSDSYIEDDDESYDGSYNTSPYPESENDEDDIDDETETEEY